jgi:conjugative relaxase-like TrwC/TraI family protein
MNGYLPILPQEANRVFKELFDADYRARHAALEPYWLGDEAKEILGLDSRLTQESFRNLLSGRTPDGRSDLFTRRDPLRPCGWHRYFAAPGSVSVLWALGPPDIKQLAANAHESAAESELVRMNDITGHPHDLGERETSHLLFACFPACASREQVPRLHTYAVLINAAFWHDGRVERLSPKRRNIVEKVGDGHYYYDVAMHFRVNLGEFRVQNWGEPEYKIVGVPEELYQVSIHRQLHGDSRRQKPVLCADGSAGSTEELFECWRRQAAAFGWGYDEIKAMARCIRRERACGKSGRRPIPGLSIGAHRDRMERMTDHLLEQQIARNEAKREKQKHASEGNPRRIETENAQGLVTRTTGQPARRTPSITVQQNRSPRPRLKV